MGPVVQGLSVVGLLAIVVAAVIVFVRMMGSKDDRGKIGKFLIIQVLLFIAVAGSLYLGSSVKPDPVGFVMVSCMLTLIANLPIAIVAKIVGAIMGTFRKPQADDSAQDNQ